MRDPPDYLVDDRIAVEVRRLNQNYESNGRYEGLEKVAEPTYRTIQKILKSFGPPRCGISWYVSFRFRRPNLTKQIVIKRVKYALECFINNPIHDNVSLYLGDDLSIEIEKADRACTDFYELFGFGDDDEGGWLLQEMERNVKLCICEKTEKTERVRALYSYWWLVLVDHISYATARLRRDQLRPHIPCVERWSKIIILHPSNDERWYEI